MSSCHAVFPAGKHRVTYSNARSNFSRCTSTRAIRTGLKQASTSSRRFVHGLDAQHAGARQGAEASESTASFELSFNRSDLKLVIERPKQLQSKKHASQASTDERQYIVSLTLRTANRRRQQSFR